MASEIVWTRGAEEDLFRVYSHWERALQDHDDLIEASLFRPLLASLDLLSLQPAAGSKVVHSKKLRRWLIGPRRRYGLFYAVEGSKIVIHAMLDLRQDPGRIRERIGGL